MPLDASASGWEGPSAFPSLMLPCQTRAAGMSYEGRAGAVVVLIGVCGYDMEVLP